MALSYRIAFGVLAGYLGARLAPAASMRHVLVLGVVAASIAAFVTITRYDLGPAWYPIAIAVTALAWRPAAPSAITVIDCGAASESPRVRSRSATRGPPAPAHGAIGERGAGVVASRVDPVVARRS
jgi:hypothetical protein